MATTKTIQPTGTTITMPAMTDRPDASVFSTDISRITDAVNAISSGKTETIILTSSDTAWSQVWAKINTLSVGSTATIYSPSTQSGILTKNVRSNSLYGLISRGSSTRFYLMYAHSTATNLFGIGTLDASSSEATGYSERDITGRLSEIPVYKKFTITNGASVTIDNSSHVEIDLMGGTNGRCGTMQVSTSAAGTVFHNQVGASSVSITKATNKITFAVDGTTYAWCTIYQGDITLDT